MEKPAHMNYIAPNRRLESRFVADLKIRTMVHPISTNKKLGMVVHTCHTRSVGSINRRTEVQRSPGLQVRPYTKNTKTCQALVAHTCNPSYSKGREEEDRGSKPAWEKCLL
jgi:hypothetical protein